MKRTIWTPEQDAILRQQWGKAEITTPEIAERVEHTVDETRWRAVKLDLGPKASPPRRGQHDQSTRDQIAELWTGTELTASEIGQRIHVPRNTVISLAHRMGLPKREGFWNKARVEELTALWKAEDLSAAEIGERLGVSKESVASKAKHLGLRRRSPEAKRLIHQRRTPKSSAPKAAAPKSPLIIVGNGGIVEKPDGQASPLPAVKRAAWEALPGVTPVARLHAGRQHCRWPITVVGDELSHCCGAIATDGSYCRAHRRMSAAPSQPKKPSIPADPNVIRRRAA